MNRAALRIRVTTFPRLLLEPCGSYPGSVAQGIEQRFPKPCVGGSNPLGATTSNTNEFRLLPTTIGPLAPADHAARIPAETHQFPPISRNIGHGLGTDWARLSQGNLCSFQMIQAGPRPGSTSPPGSRQGYAGIAAGLAPECCLPRQPRRSALPPTARRRWPERSTARRSRSTRLPAVVCEGQGARLRSVCAWA